jgi:hypothetical protein
VLTYRVLFRKNSVCRLLKPTENTTSEDPQGSMTNSKLVHIHSSLGVSDCYNSFQLYVFTELGHTQRSINETISCCLATELHDLYLQYRAASYKCFILLPIDGTMYTKLKRFFFQLVWQAICATQRKTREIRVEDFTFAPWITICNSVCFL